MENKDKNILKKGMMETNSDFTSSLMDQINAEDKALSNVLSEHGEMAPSVDFTANLMTQLEGKSPAKVYKPVISKRAWIGIAAAMVGFVVLTISLAGETSGSSRFDLNTSALADNVTSLFKNGSTIMYIGFGVLLLSVGLVLEQRVSGKAE